ncbi:MAG TPA: hypothetical protein VFV87_12490, partial [Pirellulaceae bacterium]|nr:hypothetical protein [Pirellulaceae bacterium]
MTERAGLRCLFSPHVAFCVLMAGLLGGLFVACPASAQVITTTQRPPQSAPHEGYFNCFGSFYEGDFLDAGRDFRDAGRGGIASTEGRWIDSICYYTMMGECYYQMGKMGDALDQ